MPSRTTVALLLVLALALLLALLFTRSSPGEPSAIAKQPRRASPPSPPAPRASTDVLRANAVSQPQPESPSSAPALQRTGVKTRLRVATGETAVLGYYEIKPGTMGLTMVTPELQADGNVAMRIQTLELPDAASMRDSARDVLPDIFDLDRSSTISFSRHAELLRWLTRHDQVKRVSYPTIVTSAGHDATIRTATGGADGTSEGVTYALRADALPDAAGVNLSIEFEHSDTRTHE